MALTATLIYWVIVIIWACVLGFIVSYSRKARTIFGSARVLLAVVAIDTLCNSIENVYFGLYFSSQYGFLSPSVRTVLGQPMLLILPKIINVAAGLVVLCVFLIRWFPNAAREHDNLAVLATVDGLTGLYNRRHFLALASVECERSQRHNRPLAMLMLDIDHFKSVNDRYGHDVGDAVIREVAAICRRTVRATDIPARLGGEEFGILLPETTSEGAMAYAARLRAEVLQMAIPVHGGHLRVTVSGGVSERHHAMTLDELIKHADFALYDAKRSGRDRVAIYDLVMRVPA
jgi:diguanylate cyclase (GGDEF)-like protein